MNNDFELYKGPYKADETEQKVLKFWLSHDFYKPEYNGKTGKTDTTEELKKYLKAHPDQKFCIIDPPPNAYDRPHLGNISGYAYQDLLGRFWRLKGKRVLLFPGKDHAGIQGEIVVLREHFKKQGKSKQNLTRDEFYKETYEYFLKMMQVAQNDEQRIGLSADFSRDVFTLEPEIVKNVLSTFIKLFNDGQIYKNVRIVNWCPSCQTVLADVDTKKKTIEGTMYYITYGLKNSKDIITVATTRPETMLGDTALVVNPKDERYKNLYGKVAILPLLGRELPIITDPIVDKEAGSGVLKLTPAHAPEDYDIMLRWNATHPKEKVDTIAVIHKDNKIVGSAGKYVGMDVEEARNAVISDLEKEGLFVKKEMIEQRIPICERCKTVIQPILSSQWFINVSELKKLGIDAVTSGQVTIHPKYMTKKYLHWMNIMRDWPISRSLWWGYGVPVWYKGEVKEWIDKNGQIKESINEVAVESFVDAVEKNLAKVSIENPGEGWIQDKDVFDTWFSSGQWPFVILEREGLLDTFYPTDVLETGYDILEFWVSRMIMLGKYRTGKYPFTDVYLRGLILGADGQKMSKSRGNMVSLDEIISDYGADGLRLLYIVGNKAGAGYRLDNEKLKGYRNFINKIWNASKFVLGSLSDVEDIHAQDPSKLGLEKVDKEMLKKLGDLSLLVEEKIRKFRFGLVAVDVYNSFWHDFCDVYLEAIKSRLYTKDKEGNPINQTDSEKASKLAAQWSLWKSLTIYLKLLHPYIPFITEYIWQSIPKSKDESSTIMYSHWPDISELKQA